MVAAGPRSMPTSIPEPRTTSYGRSRSRRYRSALASVSRSDCGNRLIRKVSKRQSAIRCAPCCRSRAPIPAFNQRVWVRAVLLLGPDAGLVRERAETVARTVCADLQDAFRVADLAAATIVADPARLADESAQISLMGGRRLVQVRDAGDNLAPIFSRFLGDAPGDSLVVVEAGDLPGRSSLRRAFDDAPQAAAIGCYPDGPRELANVIRDS